MGDKGQIHYVDGKPVADGTMVQIPVRDKFYSTRNV